LTYTPAVLLRSNDEIGTLAEGSIADITVLKVSATEHTISDSEGKEITLSHTYIPSKIFKDGNLFDTDQKMFQDLC
jgi:dihydroorotase